jgi:hypothetical protein
MIPIDFLNFFKDRVLPPNGNSKLHYLHVFSLGPMKSNTDHIPRPNMTCLQSRYTMITSDYHVSLRAEKSFSVRFHHCLGNADLLNVVSQFPTPISHLVMHARSPLLFNGIEITYCHYNVFYVINYPPHSFTTIFARQYLGLSYIWHSILFRTEFMTSILHLMCFGRISVPIMYQSDIRLWIVKSRCSGEMGDYSCRWL